LVHPNVFSEIVKKDSEEQEKKNKEGSREAEGIPEGIQANDFSPVTSEWMYLRQDKPAIQGYHHQKISNFCWHNQCAQ